jgi:hypothetical protein
MMINTEMVLKYSPSLNNRVTTVKNHFNNKCTWSMLNCTMTTVMMPGRLVNYMAPAISSSGAANIMHV